MIELNPALAADLSSPDALRTAVQQALMLEHSTIPPYLYALYSLDESVNPEVFELVRSVVVEEMTHMALAGNLLNALGGTPVIDEPAFIPTYPGPLPGSVEGGLVVGLAPFSVALVRDVFMVIEQPEEPLEFPALAPATAPVTIGAFYAAIRAQLPDAAFVGDPSRQVIDPLMPELVGIVDAQSAIAAIDFIVEQGEGTTTSPLEGDEIAHYYRFNEIVHGHHLVPVPDPPPDAQPDELYAYDGDPIAFDSAGVRPAIVNPTAAGYADPRARGLCDTFNYTYTGVLRSLHATFNGAPDQLGAAIGLMESCREQALALMEVGLPGGGRAGPSFEYRPTNP